ncbi:hypothetical protein CkaCkLH20_09712 [Colletotrichum karsti]|uniref:Uncharacterized protein n=1 Tax=Colletotrichum karsti TaxID=1095194 RepID=A0A9P6LE74_9PEZI|nr:uncharacterized protein CkaCkLH20_09712 [Colletotrichum karsti]KAF9872849.1 hypothetical protein CkaCkLH20_09712 [Colletotrichum karsti]
MGLKRHSSYELIMRNQGPPRKRLKVEVLEVVGAADDVMVEDDVVTGGGLLDVEELIGAELDEEVVGWGIDEDEVAAAELDGDELGVGELDGGELDGGELDGDELDGGELDGGELDGGELDGGELDGEELAGEELEGGALEGGKLDDEEKIGWALDDAGLLPVEEVLEEAKGGPEIGVVITGDAGTLENVPVEVKLEAEETMGPPLDDPEETLPDPDAELLRTFELAELVIEEVLPGELLATDALEVDTGRLEVVAIVLLGGLLGAIPPLMTRMNSPTNRSEGAALDTGLDEGPKVTGVLGPTLVCEGPPDETELDTESEVELGAPEGDELGCALLPETTPDVTETTPDVTETTPDVTETTPDVTELGAKLDPDGVSEMEALSPELVPKVVADDVESDPVFARGSVGRLDEDRVTVAGVIAT